MFIDGSETVVDENQLVVSTRRSNSGLLSEFTRRVIELQEAEVELQRAEQSLREFCALQSRLDYCGTDSVYETESDVDEEGF